MRRVAVDTGGTFTDVVAMEEDGRLEYTKSLTTYPDPADGFFSGLGKLGGARAEYLGHGTTLATNALLTNRGGSVALITTRGFRDVLEIRRTHRNSLFDIYEELPAPLVPRDLRFEVAERTSSEGSIVTPLVESEVRSAAAEIRRRGIDAVAVCYLFGFANPVNERRTKEILREELPEMWDRITLSSEVLPLHREYERTSTTVASAILMPVLRGYLAGLERRVLDSGAAKTLLIMQNTGGLVSPQRAADLPVLTLLSGPAAGATATAFLGGLWAEKRLLALDMGGTSTDVSAVIDGHPGTKLDFRIGEYDLSYPSIDIHTIGAGGGSQARVDAHGRLTVGPESSGSTPGPACYGRGGEIPTVTDANFVLGYLDPDSALGGEITMDRSAAEHAIKSHVAGPLGLSMDEAALGIVAIVNSNMMHALRFVSIERGHDPREYTLVPFGGAGPMHGAALAREIGIRRVLIPPIPGCTSAMGILAADLRHESVRAIHRRLLGDSVQHLRASIAEMSSEVKELLRDEGVPRNRIRVHATLDLRYVGQAYELPIPMPAGASDTLQKRLGARFHREHRRRYGHTLGDEQIEVINARVTGIGLTDKPRLVGGATGARNWRDAASGKRALTFEGGAAVEAPVLQRLALTPGMELPTPCLVTQLDSTTLIPPGTRATVDPIGSILLELA